MSVRILRPLGAVTLLVSVLATLTAADAMAGEATPSPRVLRAARDAVFKRPEFQYGAARGRSFLADWFDAWSEFVGSLYERHPVVYLIALAGLAALALLLIAHIIWTVRMARRAEWLDESAPDLTKAMLRGDPSPFRARAIEHAAEGRFDEAVRDLYTALLLTLDRRGTLRHAPYKALLDYRLEAARDAEAAHVLDAFAGTYHPGSFGRRPPERQRFDDLLAALDGIAAAPR